MSLTEWAHVCDKSIKAYRLANIHIGALQSLKMYKSGAMSEKLAKENIKFQNHINALMNFVIYIYKAPLRDVLEYRKVKTKFDDMLKQNRFDLFTHPIVVF